MNGKPLNLKDQAWLSLAFSDSIPCPQCWQMASLISESSLSLAYIAITLSKRHFERPITMYSDPGGGEGSGTDSSAPMMHPGMDYKNNNDYNNM